MFKKIVTSPSWFVAWALIILGVQLFQGFTSAAHLVAVCSAR